MTATLILRDAARDARLLRMRSQEHLRLQAATPRDAGIRLRNSTPSPRASELLRLHQLRTEPTPRRRERALRRHRRSASTQIPCASKCRWHQHIADEPDCGDALDGDFGLNRARKSRIIERAVGRRGRQFIARASLVPTGPARTVQGRRRDNRRSKTRLPMALRNSCGIGPAFEVR